LVGLKASHLGCCHCHLKAQHSTAKKPTEQAHVSNPSWKREKEGEQLSLAQHAAPSACIIAQVMGRPITSACSIMKGMEELVASQIKKNHI